MDGIASHRPQEMVGIAAKAALLQEVGGQDTPQARLAHTLAIDVLTYGARDDPEHGTVCATAPDREVNASLAELAKGIHTVH